MVRDLQSSLIGHLIIVPGIITHASRASIKASTVIVRCKNCGHEKQIAVGLGYAGFSIPRQCDNARNPGLDKQQCKLDTYAVITDKCTYIDHQSLKL